MIRKYMLPGLAVFGVLLAIYTVISGAKPVPISVPVAQPARSPYEHYVAGAGIVEARTENIALGVPVAQVVTEVLVKVHDHIVAGQPLMKLDDRAPRMELAVRRANFQSAQARQKEAQANFADIENQFKLWSSADQAAISRDELSKRRYAVEVAAARRDTAVAEVAAADAAVKQAEDEVDRYVVCAPKQVAHAQVLQVNIRPGEYAMAGGQQQPMILLGDVDTLHVRVDVDENDAWKVDPSRDATAFVRGNSNLTTKLKFVRIEPFVVPKKSLTGDSTERVDTRVLQVIYGFDRKDLNVYVGQQMDVYIDSPPPGEGSSRPAEGGK